MKKESCEILHYRLLHLQTSIIQHPSCLETQTKSLTESHEVFVLVVAGRFVGGKGKGTTISFINIFFYLGENPVTICAFAV